MTTEPISFISRYNRAVTDQDFKHRIEVAIARAVMAIALEPNTAANHEVRAKLAGMIASPIKPDGTMNPAYNLAIDRFARIISYTSDLFISLDANGQPVPLVLDLSLDEDVYSAVMAYWDLAAKVAGITPTTTTPTDTGTGTTTTAQV